MALLRCADSAGRNALVGDTALDSELVTLRSPVSTALRERTRALEEKEASEEENGSSSTDDDKRYALLRRLVVVLDASMASSSAHVERKSD